MSVVFKLLDKSFIRFCLVGVLATGIHYGIYYLLLKFCSANIAFTIGYLTSFCCNYLLTAKFTFKKKTTAKNGIGFALSHLVNYGLQMLFLNIFLALGMGEKIAPLPVYCICVPINYLLVRFVFNKI